MTLRLLLAVALALCACPKLPPVSGCEPLSQRCDSDTRRCAAPPAVFTTSATKPAA